MSVAIVTIPVHALPARLGDLAHVYTAMYALPDTAGTRFAALLTDHATRDGFTLCAALDDPTGQCVGLAYGFTGLPGQPWRDALAAVMGDDMARDWLTGYFEFAKFGIIPARRRAGIGGQLHEALFRDVPQYRAVLNVRQGNHAARALYDRRGWVTLHDVSTRRFPTTHRDAGRTPSWGANCAPGE